MVMVMKRSARQSLVDLTDPKAQSDRQGPRRLRFPFFDQLVKEHQRRLYSAGLLADCRNDKASSGEPVEPSGIRWSKARRGRQRQKCAATRWVLAPDVWVVNRPFEKRSTPHRYILSYLILRRKSMIRLWRVLRSRARRT